MERLLASIVRSDETDIEASEEEPSDTEEYVDEDDEDLTDSLTDSDDEEDKEGSLEG